MKSFQRVLGMANHDVTFLCINCKLRQYSAFQDPFITSASPLTSGHISDYEYEHKAITQWPPQYYDHHITTTYFQVSFQNFLLLLKLHVCVPKVVLTSIFTCAFIQNIFLSKMVLSRGVEMSRKIEKQPPVWAFSPAIFSPTSELPLAPFRSPFYF